MCMRYPSYIVLVLAVHIEYVLFASRDDYDIDDSNDRKLYLPAVVKKVSLGLIDSLEDVQLCCSNRM